MKKIYMLIFIAIIGAGGWWAWQNNPSIFNSVHQYIDNSEFTTLEVRYSPEKLMDLHAKELLGTSGRKFQKPELKFEPYLLMDVKFTSPDQRTREGVILWSLVDGEMVIDCETWEKTHGFEDTINAQASRNDFKIINALAKNRTKVSVDQLQRDLHVEPETLQPWLESVRQKHLVIQKGNDVQLHVQNPKISVLPQTKISQCLVSKPYNHAQKIGRKYSSGQIEKIALAAFGQDFTIRSSKEVFLPVYSIEVLNPDGSILTSYWNAINGQRITPQYLAQTD